MQTFRKVKKRQFHLYFDTFILKSMVFTQVFFLENDRFSPEKWLFHTENNTEYLYLYFENIEVVLFQFFY